ncbi:hypothetical protein OQA88_11887 [Cercophora sp. LCS_1]
MAESTDAVPLRRPYTGSCHCGFTKYIVYLTFPHDPPPTTQRRGPDGRLRQHMYRCNCTTCQKAGIMHIRLPSPPDDFLLLSPLKPFEELGDYQCNEEKLHFFFCKACGMRCFSFMGEGELVEKEVGNETKTVWCPKRGWYEDLTKYMSVNAYTLDAGQERLDLREWTEKKWVMYLDCLVDTDQTVYTPPPITYERPYEGGAY